MCDFMVLDVGKDKYIPLIFGRPFLTTTRICCDFKRGAEKVTCQGKVIIQEKEHRNFEQPLDRIVSCFKVDARQSVEESLPHFTPLQKLAKTQKKKRKRGVAKKVRTSVFAPVR